MCLPTLPLDVLIEIFSWDLTKYALFQNLCRETRAAKTPYDGWDSLVAQGHRVEIANDTIKWYKNGNLHRDYDLPAIEYSSGAKFWYQEGDLHREGDLPAIIYGNDIKEWRQRGLLHRDGDLPAFIHYGTKWWYKNGKKHRDYNLPAMESFSGNKEWWIDGELIREESWAQALEKHSRAIYGF